MPVAPFSATCWPPGVMPLAVNAEIVRVEEIEGDTVTLSARGVETSAQLIGPGWQFAQMITAGDFEQLQTLIEAETARAEGAEGALTTALGSASGSAKAEVQAEATARANADTALSTGITSAIATAEAASDAVGTAAADVATEKTRALAAEGTIATNLATEVTNRTTAVAGAITTAEAASDAAGTAAADVATEKTRALAAEALLVPLTEVGANSGVMGLTAGGIGAQAPAHHASSHAEGGSDPLTVADLPVSVANGSGVSAGRVPIANGANVFEYVDPDQTNPKHAPYFAKFDGQSTTLAKITASTNLLTVTGVTFAAIDIGKKCWVQGAGAGGALLYTTITGVLGGVAELAESASTTVTGAVCYWGTDDTTALQTWLNDLGSEFTKVRKGQMPHGVAFFTQLVVPNNVDVNAQGWGTAFGSLFGAGAFFKSGTVLFQLPNTNKDGVVFTPTPGTEEFTGPLNFGGFVLQSDLSNTTGRGVSLVDNTGLKELSPSDGFRVHDICAGGFPSDGFFTPNGSDIYPFPGCRAFNNGGYGLDYQMNTFSNSADIVDFSGDQNALGLMHIEGIGAPTLGTINISGMKSEMHVPQFRNTALGTKSGTCTTGSNLVTGLGSTTGLYHGAAVSSTAFPADTYIEKVNSPTEVTLSAPSTETGSKSLVFTAGYQVNAIVCDNLGPKVFIHVDTLKHIAGSPSVSAPGEAIRINTGPVPQIVWDSVLVRVKTTQSNGNPVVIKDATITGEIKTPTLPYHGEYGIPATSFNANTTQLLRQQLAQGRQNVADEVDAPVMTRPPTTAFEGTKFGNSQIVAGVISSPYSALTKAGHLVPWTDPRIVYIGGVPAEYPAAGYGATLAGKTEPYESGSRIVTEQLVYACADITCEEFEILFFGATTGYYRIWIDGQPHSAERVQVTPSDGYLYLLRVRNLPRGRARYQVKVELDSCLFGGFNIRNVDSLLRPQGVGTGGAALFVGDSLLVAHGVAARATYGMRVARRLGYDRVFLAGLGGTGFYSDEAHSEGGTTGTNYLKRVELDRPKYPSDIGLIVGQGSHNDRIYLTGNTVTDKKRIEEITAKVNAFWNYVKEQWPQAYCVMTGLIMQRIIAKAGGATDTGSPELNQVYKEIAEARGDLLFIDASAKGWYTGETYTEETGNAFYNLFSDNQHSTIEGQQSQGDNIAQEIISSLGAGANTHRQTPIPVVGTGLYPGFVGPLPPHAMTANATLSSLGEIYAYRVTVPFDMGPTPVLHDLSVYVKTSSGNLRLAVYDTGDAAAGVRTLLAQSGSLVCGGENSWQTPYDPKLAVYPGQQLDLVLQADNATAAFGRAGAVNSSNQFSLPSNFIPARGGASPKTAWVFKLAAYEAFPATVTEAHCEVTAGVSAPMIIARVAPS
jgi:hypothetical protein